MFPYSLLHTVCKLFHASFPSKGRKNRNISQMKCFSMTILLKYMKSGLTRFGRILLYILWFFVFVFFFLSEQLRKKKKSGNLGLPVCLEPPITISDGWGGVGTDVLVALSQFEAPCLRQAALSSEDFLQVYLCLGGMGLDPVLSPLKFLKLVSPWFVSVLAGVTGRNT